MKTTDSGSAKYRCKYLILLAFMFPDRACAQSNVQSIFDDAGTIWFVLFMAAIVIISLVGPRSRKHPPG